MSYLTKDAILSAVDVPSQEVAVPEWGGTVLVQGMTGTERDSFEALAVAARQNKKMVTNASAELVVRCVVDEEGSRIFTTKDVAALGKKSGLALGRVVDVALELSGLSDDNGDLTENFSEGQSDDSTSD